MQHIPSSLDHLHRVSRSNADLVAPNARQRSPRVKPTFQSEPPWPASPEKRPSGRIAEMAQGGAALRHCHSLSGTLPSDDFGWPARFGLTGQRPKRWFGRSRQGSGRCERMERRAEAEQRAAKTGLNTGGYLIRILHPLLALNQRVLLVYPRATSLCTKDSLTAERDAEKPG